MTAKKMFIVIGIIILIIIGGFYAYINALGSMWIVNPPNKSPYYITTKPTTINNILLPERTKITYKKNYYWEEYEQDRLPDEKDITEITFEKGTTINWGGIPITSIDKFFNPEMKGFTVYANFNKLDKSKETKFSNLWQNCNSDIGVTVKNTNDWSFNKKNILDIQSCGILYLRYYKDDIKQQKYLDNLYDALMNVND